MKVACKLLLGLALLQGAAYAADEPKIDVIDGKISISAVAVPLARFLTLFDRAMGMKSEVKAGLGLENWNISVQFTDLNFNDAVRKIFQGQPLNYMVIKGKGIRVMDKAQGGTTTGVADSQPFNTPFNNPPPPPQNLPIQVQQQQQQQQNPIQPTQPSIFGTPAPAAANPSAPLTGPGVMPPPLGANNPLINPVGGAAAGGNVTPSGNSLPMGGPTVLPQQPAAPGTLPGAMPGAAPGTVR